MQPNQLYGLSFKERFDIPVYQKDVRVFEVFDADKNPSHYFTAIILREIINQEVHG